jgi:hypothetical protein
MLPRALTVALFSLSLCGTAVTLAAAADVGNFVTRASWRWIDFQFMDTSASSDYVNNKVYQKGSCDSGSTRSCLLTSC